MKHILSLLLLLGCFSLSAQSTNETPPAGWEAVPNGGKYETYKNGEWILTQENWKITDDNNDFGQAIGTHYTWLLVLVRGNQVVYNFVAQSLDDALSLYNSFSQPN